MAKDSRKISTVALVALLLVAPAARSGIERGGTVMAQDIKRLGDGELDIMMAAWGTKGRVNSSYIQEKLKTHRQWTLPAVATALNRLVEKGFLACEKKGRSNYYRPLVSEEAYKAAEGRTFLEKLYGNSFAGMVASLYDSRAIGPEDLEDLRRFLDELEGK